MVANYPYFGLPNYMNYMNPNAFKNVQPPKYRIPKPQPVYKVQSNFQPNVPKPPKKEKAKQQEPPLFSFLGINLYFDDVLILCILFFLYNEQVNDPYLFFILVLLLLT